MALMSGQTVPSALANSHAPTYDYYFLMKYDAYAQPLRPLNRVVLEQALNVCLFMQDDSTMMYYLWIDFGDCSFE